MSTLQVEIVRLNPMRVAVFHGFGAEPEFQAMNKLIAWAHPRSLLDGSPAHRIFGFNNPSPTAASPHYGYEFWIELSEAEAESLAASGNGGSDGSGGDVELKSFNGGVYAVTRCHGVAAIPDAWRDLVTWCEDSPYAFGQAQCLEQHIGALDGSVEELDFALYQAVAA
jgi:AraC family transcriptional regulator